jgi:hypothetical protein
MLPPFSGLNIGSITNYMEIVGKCSAQFHIMAVSKHSFHVTLGVTFSFKRIKFLIKQ